MRNAQRQTWMCVCVCIECGDRWLISHLPWNTISFHLFLFPFSWIDFLSLSLSLALLLLTTPSLLQALFVTRLEADDETSKTPLLSQRLHQLQPARIFHGLGLFGSCDALGGEGLFCNLIKVKGSFCVLISNHTTYAYTAFLSFKINLCAVFRPGTNRNFFSVFDKHIAPSLFLSGNGFSVFILAFSTSSWASSTIRVTMTYVPFFFLNTNTHTHTHTHTHYLELSQLRHPSDRHDHHAHAFFPFHCFIF